MFFLKNHFLKKIAIEFHRLKRKWIFSGIYKPPAQGDNKFIKIINKVRSKYLDQFENILIAGDFNMTIDNPYLHTLLQLFGLTVLINTPTYYQFYNLTCIDHFFNKIQTLFKLYKTFEISLSDHHNNPVNSAVKM